MVATPSVIAVLDDDARMRTALRRLLSVHGFQVEEFERGADFLAVPPSHPVDCLVLDLHMDGLSGFDVLDAFATRHVTTPVVVITGHDRPGTGERVRALGASSYLTKPVDESVLLNAIRCALSLNKASSSMPPPAASSGNTAGVEAFEITDRTKSKPQSLPP